MTVQVGDHSTLLVLPLGADFATPWPVSNFDTFDDRFARDWPDWRRVLMKTASPNALYHVLWWGGDWSVPEGLDDLIRADAVTIEDLRDACIAEFSGVTCLACKAQIRVLTMDDSVTRLLGTRPPPPEAWQRSCPVCHERIAIPILEFVD